MKIINDSFEILNPELSNEYLIERAARTCYKSEGRMGKEPNLEFIDKHRKHEGIFEHGKIILKVDSNVFIAIKNSSPKFLNLTFSEENGFIISGNIRAFRDYIKDNNNNFYMCYPFFYYLLYFLLESCNFYFKDIEVEMKELYFKDNNSVQLFYKKYEDMTKIEKLNHIYQPVLITTDRGITHEIVRHRRESSYCQESTRYCNYSLDKFENQITVIDQKEYLNEAQYDIWKDACEVAEANYFLLLKTGCTAQQARSVLPNSTKSDIFITMTLKQWHHFLSLRTQDNCHYQMYPLARRIHSEFVKLYPGLFEDIKY